MEPFETLTGVVAPLPIPNIDTDQIIPKQFLKSIRRTGFGEFLFDKWRYLDEGQPEQDCTRRPKNPEFVLNQKAYAAAKILVAGANFGCGSSREHAPWALREYGFRVLIAPSFSDIFFNNCFKNGLLPIMLDEQQVNEIVRAAQAQPGYQLTVDLNTQRIRGACGGINVLFEIDAARKTALLCGLDEISMTLEFSEEIRAYEEKRQSAAPWVFHDLVS